MSKITRISAAVALLLAVMSSGCKSSNTCSGDAAPAGGCGCGTGGVVSSAAPGGAVISSGPTGMISSTAPSGTMGSQMPSGGSSFAPNSAPTGNGAFGR